MSESTITVQGYVGSTPILREAGGHVVANFRLACTPRRFDRKEQKWVDSATSWFNVSAWRVFGENVAASVKTGDPVIVTGRLVMREWTNSMGEAQSSYEIEAVSIGHDLTRACTALVRKPTTPSVVPARKDEAPDPFVDETENRREAGEDWGGYGPEAEPVELAVA